MEIKVLGPGCARCHELDKITREIANEMGIDAKVEHIQDINKIIEYAILITPGLMVNGKLVCSGRVPSKAEIKQFITDALAE
jgi:small redox-active disulfide protein 2